MKNFLKKIFASAVALTPAISLAQITVPQGAGVQVKTATDVGNVIGKVANFMGSLILAISVIIILYAGFKFLTAGDNDEAVTGARKMITWGIVGIIVALVAYSVPFLVQNITGVGTVQ